MFNRHGDGIAAYQPVRRTGATSVDAKPFVLRDSR